MHLVIPLLALIGCIHEDPEACPDLTEDAMSARLDIGTGLEHFIALEPGDGLDLHHGMQGGQHVYLSIHAEGFNPGHSAPFSGPKDSLELDLSVWQNGEEIGGFYANWVVLDGDREDAEYLGTEVVLWPDWALLDEDPVVEVRATLIDACGVELTLSQEQALRP